MTPEQLEIVQTTAPRLEAAAGRFGDAFYNTLFGRAPQLRELFPDDLTVQKSKLVDEVTFLAAAAGDLDTFVDRASGLGARHHDYGVHVADYTEVEAALLAAISAVLGDDATDEVLTSWQRLYRLIAETMIAGAADELYSVT